MSILLLLIFILLLLVVYPHVNAVYISNRVVSNGDSNTPSACLPMLLSIYGLSKNLSPFNPIYEFYTENKKEEQAQKIELLMDKLGFDKSDPKQVTFFTQCYVIQQNKYRPAAVMSKQKHKTDIRVYIRRCFLRWRKMRKQQEETLTRKEIDIETYNYVGANVHTLPLSRLESLDYDEQSELESVDYDVESVYYGSEVTNDRKHSFSSQTTAPICNTRSTSTIRPAVYFPVDDYSQNCNCRCCRQRKRKERFHLNVKTNLGQICEADYVQRSLMTIDESQESDLMECTCRCCRLHRQHPSRPMQPQWKKNQIAVHQKNHLPPIYLPSKCVVFLTLIYTLLVVYFDVLIMTSIVDLDVNKDPMCGNTNRLMVFDISPLCQKYFKEKSV